MISGNKSQFAIEYEIDELCGGRWLFGKICYWIENTRLGDYEVGTSLQYLKDFMHGVFDKYEKLLAPDLFDVPAGDIFRMLESAVFGDGHEVDKYFNSELQLEIPGIFLITPPVDVFDECRAYIIGGLSRDKIVYKSNMDSQVSQIIVEKEIIKNIFSEFTKWLDSIDVR